MSNSSSSGRQRRMGGGSHHVVLEYLKRIKSQNPSFFYAIQTSDDDNNNNDNSSSSSSPNIFWADVSSKINYSYFGDTLTFHTPYLSVSPYRLPFASFTGINHHGHPVLFGSALIFNHSDSSFIWLFQTWLHAMSAPPPSSITTLPDNVLQIAVANVFPQARHRFCKFGIFRDTRDKLPHIYHSHPTFEADFRNCINQAYSVDDFESAWQSLLQRYYLTDNEWLQSLYNVRQQWVPVFLRNTFFGDLCERDGIGASDSFFESYVNASTTMHVLIKQYEKAVASWLEKEVKADYETTNSTPFLKTPSPMEKQAANIYTRRIFIKFQEELVETLANPATKIEDSGTITTYRVAKFGEEHRAHTVNFSSFEMKASCSCQMFEYSGIICRHILAVFRAKNVLTLPSQYVLKRWTRDAKRGDGSDDQASELPNSSQESLPDRYNSLRLEVIKYIEEGAKSIHIYNVAMHALQEAAKKVAATKNQSTGATQGATLTNGSSEESQETEEHRSGMLQSADEKEKRIRELSAEIENTNERCEVYRANLLAILRDMEDEKLKLSVKVQNARLTLKQ